MDHEHATSLLRQVAGPHAAFRPGQYEAIEALVMGRRSVLVVQRTGWGKSAVYLIATSLLRAAGGGPTIIVSPLVSLMRNQLSMAQTLGLEARTIHSLNRDEWDGIYTPRLPRTRSTCC